MEGLLSELEKESVQSPKPKKQKTSKQTIELNFLKNQAKFTPVEITKDSKVETKKVIHRDEATLIETGSLMVTIAEEFMKLKV